KRGTIALEGLDIREKATVTSLAMARYNRTAGSASDLRDAVSLLDNVGSPFAEDSGAEWRRIVTPAGEGPVKKLPASPGLALEMATHEEQERLFLASHLSLLTDAWKEAEEIAAIADDLLVPGWVRDRIGG